MPSQATPSRGASAPFGVVQVSRTPANAELTATPRTGWQRYTFPAAIEGRVHAGNFCAGKDDYTVFFTARFDRPFASFGTSTYRDVVLKAGRSYTGPAGARANLAAETGDVDGSYTGFDRKVHRAEGYTPYQNLSLWETYRPQNQLLELLTPAGGAGRGAVRGGDRARRRMAAAVGAGRQRHQHHDRLSGDPVPAARGLAVQRADRALRAAWPAVPQDRAGLVGLTGGRKATEKRLDGSSRSPGPAPPTPTATSSGSGSTATR
ncbi:glycoside hydrolase domain-containing protein [Actinoplanes sp. CA-030573]|uniref:glycoside hydrolase domain-containing protein n=1 Tax=Actinoplanes sp. CA-030573 TaxID=3239898 RepID=UPI003D8C0998